jgi:hypothetical protein
VLRKALKRIKRLCLGRRMTRSNSMGGAWRKQNENGNGMGSSCATVKAPS